MEISQIKMYELFRTQFGDKESEAIVHLIDENMDAKINLRTKFLATKDDLKEAISALRISTKDDLLATKNELKEEIAALRLSTKEEIMALRESTKDDMRKLREDLTRTIYTTSMGQLFAIIVSVISLILLILNK